MSVQCLEREVVVTQAAEWWTCFFPCFKSAAASYMTVVQTEPSHKPIHQSAQQPTHQPADPITPETILNLYAIWSREVDRSGQIPDANKGLVRKHVWPQVIHSLFTSVDARLWPDWKQGWVPCGACWILGGCVWPQRCWAHPPKKMGHTKGAPKDAGGGFPQTLIWHDLARWCQMQQGGTLLRWNPVAFPCKSQQNLGQLWFSRCHHYWTWCLDLLGLRSYALCFGLFNITVDTHENTL